MPVQFEFNRFSEKQPKNGERITYIRVMRSWDREYYELESGAVEYQWREVTEDGDATGVDYIYEKDIEQPPNTVLMVYVNGDTMIGSTLWCYPEEFTSKIPGLSSTL